MDALTATADRMKALSDPTRVQVAAALAQTDELCVCDLAWITGRAENLVSHHLRTLKAAGLATSRREGKMVLYALTPSGRALLALTERGRRVSTAPLPVAHVRPPRRPIARRSSTSRAARGSCRGCRSSG